MVDPKAADRESFTGTGQLRTGAGDPAADLKALSRYSPNRTDTTIRPGWHRIAGGFGVVLALVIVTPNDAMRLGQNLKLLPFGHSEFYLVLGIIVAGSSTWLLGLFDRRTVYLSSRWRSRAAGEPARRSASPDEG